MSNGPLSDARIEEAAQRLGELEARIRRLPAEVQHEAETLLDELREFHITEKGLSVGKAYTRSEMVLTGLGLPR